MCHYFFESDYRLPCFIFFGKIFVHRNMHINHSILVCKKEPSLLLVLNTEMHWLVEQQIKTNAFYRFQCHNPLITFLRFRHIIVLSKKVCILQKRSCRGLYNLLYIGKLSFCNFKGKNVQKVGKPWG